MNLKIILFTTILFSLLISCSQEKERGDSQTEEKRSLKISDEEIKFSIPNNFNGKSF